MDGSVCFFVGVREQELGRCERSRLPRGVKAFWGVCAALHHSCQVFRMSTGRYEIEAVNFVRQQCPLPSAELS